MTQCCSYTFDPTTWREQHDRQCYLDNTWSCPHEPYEDADRCLFHLDPSTRNEYGIEEHQVQTALQEVAENSGKRRKQVIGAILTDIDWGHHIIESDNKYRLDLRHASIRGDFSLTDARLELPIDLRGADIHAIDWHEGRVSECLLSGSVISDGFNVESTIFQSDIDFTNIRFECPVIANETRFHGDSCLQSALFEETASFDGVEFQGDANLLDDDACFERACFQQTVSFKKAEFRYADFVECQFDKAVTFDETTFTGDAEFSGATFNEAVSFRGVTFEGDADVLIDDADFSAATFFGPADFDHATFSMANFEAAVFHDDTIFDDVVFESETTFAQASFATDIEFGEARFRSDSDFSGVEIDGDATFRGAEFQGGDNSDNDDLSFQEAAIAGVADFSHARFRYANFTSLIAEGATFTDTVFHRDAIFCDTVFRGRLEIDEARFKGDTTFAGSCFEAAVSARGVEFDGHHNAGNDDITFANARFEDTLDFQLAAFGYTDFSGVVFEATDFSDVIFREEVSFDDAVFRDSVSFDEVHFQADTTFTDARFDDRVRFRGTEFHGRDNVVDDDVSFAGVEFAEEVDFLAAEFQYADFSKSKFGNHATFSESVFGEAAVFTEASFDGPVTFDEARFQNDTAFDSISVAGAASFRGVEFHGGANISDDDVTFTRSSFGDSIDFTAAEFGYADFSEVEVDGEALFTEVIFTDDVLFETASFNDCIRFDEVRFQADSCFDGIHVSESTSFRGAEFHGGANIVEDDFSAVEGTFEGDVNFLGAQFRYASFEDVTVSGSAQFDETAFDREAVFSGMIVRGNTSFEESRFHDDAAFDSVSLEGPVSFRGAEFHGGDNIRDEDVTFDSATFKDDVDFTRAEFEYATFEGGYISGICDFRATRFGDKSTFTDIVFGSEVYFDETTFEDDVTFFGGTFRADTSFYGVEFEGGPSEEYDANFSDAVFEAAVDFQEIECDDFGCNNAIIHDTVSFTESLFGAVSIESTRFHGIADFSFIQCGDLVTFTESTFDKNVNMNEIRFEGDVAFDKARFESEVSFRGAEFAGAAHTIDDANFEATVFEETVDFKMAEFRFGNFAGAEFGGNAIFVEASFSAGARFQRAEFHASGLFSRAVFEDETDFSSAQFIHTAHFDEVQFRSDTTFVDTIFEDDTTFESSEFWGNSNRHSDDANFESVTFNKNANFDDVSFRYANFTNTEFNHNANFSGIEVSDSVVFRPQPVEGEDIIIDLQLASLEGGVLGQPETGRVFYDLTSGKIAAVTLDDTNCEIPLFDHFRFADTDFDGFDFTSHKAHLAENNWIIHEFAATSNHGDDDVSNIENPATLENTYLKAKNSAAEFGDRKAAAEFFIKEMLYRRKKNWQIATGESVGSIAGITLLNRVRSFGKWIGNHVLYQTCGYGERLWRVLYVSAAVILFWAVIYTLIPEGVEGSDVRSVDSLAHLASPEGLVILGRNIYFSTATFITLEYVGASPAGVTRWIASMEAFTGALLIALVVFVLGRRVAW